MKYLKLFEELERVEGLSAGQLKKLKKLVNDICVVDSAIREGDIYSESYPDNILSCFTAFMSYSDNMNKDVDGCLDLISKYLVEDKGWDLDRVKMLISKAGKSINSNIFWGGRYIEGSKYEFNESTLTDLYLYKFGGEKWLGGLKLEQFYNTYGEENELMVRYAYGYHRNHYGAIYIEQNFGSADGLQNYIADSFIHFWINMDLSHNGDIINKHLDSRDHMKRFDTQGLDISSCTKSEGNVFTITDCNELSNILVKNGYFNNDFFTNDVVGHEFISDLGSDVKMLGGKVEYSNNVMKFTF